ncbi:MAG TPA: AAA family ATPase [Thermoleophilaceae bacterium]|nr:AAA family ATPase [Thermoleophilaceae bacterium]
MEGSRPADLHEREGETALLAESLARAGDSAALLVIEGPPGIGKTRLLRSARELARARGMRVLAARASELESHVPFGVARQLFESEVLAADSERREALLSGAARQAESVFNPAAVPSGAAEDAFPQIHGLFWLASNVALEQPIALLVDDAQWADLPTLQFLDYLARRLEDSPIAVVVATRPVADARNALLARLVTDPAAAVARPSPLSHRGVAAWAAAALGAPPDEAFVASCAQATGGNPFFLGELLRELARRRLAPDERAAELAGTLAPDGVAAMVMLRLAGAPLGARELAEAVAVLGADASLADAALLAGLDRDDARRAAEALGREGILAEGEPLEFAHPVLQSAVDGSMATAERGRAHARAARILAARGAPDEEVAAHLLFTSPEGDPATGAALRAAAARAVALGAPANAVPLLERALAEPPPAEELAETLIELGAAAASAGELGAAEHLRRAVELAPDERSRARAAIELARTVLYGGGDSGVVRVLEGCLAETSDAELAEALEVQLLGMSAVSRERRGLLAPRLEALEEPPDGARGALAASTLATLAFDEAAQGRSAEEGARLAGRILPALGGQVDEGAAWAALVGTAAATWCEAFGVAERLCAVVTEDARRRGTALPLSGAANLRALLEVRRGRLDEVETEAAISLRLARESRGTHVLAALARSTAVLAAIDRGAREDELRAQLEGLAGDEPDSLPFETVLQARGALLLALGDPAAALEELRELGRRNDGWAPGTAVVQWRSGAALALARLGATEEAQALAAEELRLAEDFGAPRGIGVALRALALVSEGDRVTALEEAVAQVERSEAPVELARVLVDLGVALRHARRPRDAREPLRRALEIAQASRADGIAERARDELLAAGARPRRTALRGIAALTPSERRVADLAAAGHTNRQIAEQLFVTEKTVEGHLRNAYDKLEIRSRVELPDTLAD